MQSEYKGFYLEEGENDVVYVYDSVEAWRERRWVYTGDNEYLAKMWIDLLVGDAGVSIAEPLRQLIETIDSMNSEGEFRQGTAHKPSTEVWNFTITPLGDSVRCAIGNIGLLSKAVTFLPQLEWLAGTLATPGGLYEVTEEAKVKGPELAHQEVTFGDFLVYSNLGYLLPAGPEDDRRPSDIMEVIKETRQLLSLLIREDFVLDLGKELLSRTKKGDMAYSILHRAKYEKKWPVVIQYMESDRKEFGEAAFKSALDSCISSGLLTTVEE